jgi:hypothetical protein
MIKEVKDAYEPSTKETITELPTEAGLYKMLGKSAKEMDASELNNQLFILDEFLKYAKMAEHLFLVTQGSNFDTATINDPFLVFKKRMQLERARNTIISSVDKILESSFIGKLKNAYSDIRDMFSEVLVSDKPKVRAVMEKVLEPYVFMNDRDFVKISQKAVNDLFDWAVQTDRDINGAITSILLGREDAPSAAKQIIAFRDKVLAEKEHPLYNNLIINSIRSRSGQREGTPNNLYLLGKDGKAYNQNQIIYAFQELKQALGQDEKALYGKLVRLAVIQSGLSNSTISFTSLLPYEDFKEVYNQTLFKLEKMDNLQNFYKLNVFQRVNATNDDIVPIMRARFIKAKKPKEDGSPKWIYNPNLKFVNKKLKQATIDGRIPQTINVSPFSREGNSDIVVYIWEESLSKDKEENKRLKSEKRKKGDYSYLKKGLFQKVYYENELGKRVPLIDVQEKNGVIYENFVYKMINVWGDSFRANEFYDEPRASVIDNGFIKVEAKDLKYIMPGTTGVEITEKASGEVNDDAIVSVLSPTQTAPIVPTQAPVTADEATTKTPIEGLNERLDAYGSAKLVFSSDFYEGERPKGKLSGFKSLLAQLRDNIVVLADVNWNNFDFFLSKEDIEKLNALKPLAEELDTINTLKISRRDTRTVGVEKRFAQLSNQLVNDFVDIVGKHVEKQLGKKISSSKPRVTTTSTDEATLKSQIANLEQKKKTTGLSPVEIANLTKLQKELNKVIKSICKPKL